MGNIEQALDLGQGVYTQAEVNNKPSGFKNLIINGGFDVWQRGNSFNSVGIGDYTTDRWGNWLGSINISKHSDDIYGNYAKITGTSGTGVYFTQKIENPELLQNKRLTVSFYAKASESVNINQKVRIAHTGGNYDRNNISNIDLTTSWQKHSFTFDVNGLDYSYNDSSYLDIQLISNSNINGIDIDIAQVQLEEGSVATPFEQRPYGLELSLCQRYYWRIQGRSSDQISVCVAPVIVSGRFSPILVFPTEMRSIPTLGYSDVEIYYKGNDYIPTTFVPFDSSTYTTPVHMETSATEVVGEVGFLRTRNVSGSYIDADAEL